MKRFKVPQKSKSESDADVIELNDEEEDEEIDDVEASSEVGINLHKNINLIPGHFVNLPL
jgi:hypothetical protein